MAHKKGLLKKEEERVLVLVADIDNDLYRKTRISGPLLGRVQVLNGATQLALADPEDTDSNAMFQAVKLHDDLRKDGYAVNVAAITGSEDEGYEADREIIRQLELALERYRADSCVFVTDGAGDNRILPLVEARVKVNSIKLVVVKQSAGLESTYFTVLEKLKEPHYARIIFGIPALVILLFAVSYVLGAGWEIPAALIGLYLLVKGFGLENAFLESFRGFGFSIDRMSFVFYAAAIVFIASSFLIGLGNYTSELSVNYAIAAAYGIEGFLLLLPVAMVLYLIGRIIDTKSRRYLFRNFRYGIYIGSSIIVWVLMFSFVEWIAGQIYFSQFVDFAALAVIIGVGVSSAAGFMRNRVIRKRKLKDKLVVNELGALIGKVGGIDMKRGRFVINTSFGNPVNYNIDRIVEISDKVVVK
jgi:putative membrane protein